MMSLWDALRMNMMISYQELVRTFPSCQIFREFNSLKLRRRSNSLKHIFRIIGFICLKLLYWTSIQKKQITFTYNSVDKKQ
ncbi:hypothetical protein EI036_22010 [Escherichia coli]|nr:hypothetical protein [Escherichia coli]